RNLLPAKRLFQDNSQKYAGASSTEFRAIVTKTSQKEVISTAPWGQVCNLPSPGKLTTCPHKHYPDIHDVGSGEAGAEQVAGCLKKVIGIVATQKRLPVPPQRCRPLESPFVRNRSGGIGGPVLAVGAPAEDNDVAQTGRAEVERRRQHPFLVASAEAVLW